MGLHIQVLYANVGALANPQAKIIGVALLYDDQRDVTFRVSFVIVIYYTWLYQAVINFYISWCYSPQKVKSYAEMFHQPIELDKVKRVVVMFIICKHVQSAS